MILAVLAPPLFGFLLSAALGKSAYKRLSGLCATLACFSSFLALCLYIGLFGFKAKSFFLWPWLNAGNLSLNFSFLIDPLSLLMGLLITGAGSLIHLYSMGYMSKDPGYSRYFAYLNLFVFMMLILTMADSLPLLFVGWEGVGLCSYLLIGFWHKESANAQAGLTAFIANRIGDACFLMGIFILFFYFGTAQISDLNRLSETALGQSLPALGAFLLFLGAVGKSAQIPLHFWLPEAMAGPTPVSALIHAATMVTAGVYLLVRLSGLYSAFPSLLTLIAWTGAFTALLSALIASRQWDIKKVLAYSTISHLAYLFMAIGVKAFSAGVFHLLTHGFFKALLFLCAGSVIHGLKGERDIRLMGGLKKSMPLTFWAFLIGALSLMAFPPFSGFFSKDDILWSLFSSGNYGLFFMAFFTGLLAVFYMTRLFALVFLGESRSKAPAHESGPLMAAPLLALAFLSLTGGILGLPHLFSELLPGHPPHFLHDLLKSLSPEEFKGSLLAEALLMALSSLAGLALMALAAAYYLKAGKEKRREAFWQRLLGEAFFIPQGIENQIQPFFRRTADEIFNRVERGFFHQAAYFLSHQTLKLRELFSLLQNGSLPSYALYFVIGLTGLTMIMFLR